MDVRGDGKWLLSVTPVTGDGNSVSCEGVLTASVAIPADARDTPEPGPWNNAVSQGFPLKHVRANLQRLREQLEEEYSQKR